MHKCPHLPMQHPYRRTRKNKWLNTCTDASLHTSPAAHTIAHPGPQICTQVRPHASARSSTHVHRHVWVRTHAYTGPHRCRYLAHARKLTAMRLHVHVCKHGYAREEYACTHTPAHKTHRHSIDIHRCARSLHTSSLRLVWGVSKLTGSGGWDVAPAETLTPHPCMAVPTHCTPATELTCHTPQGAHTDPTNTKTL